MSGAEFRYTAKAKVPSFESANTPDEQSKDEAEKKRIRDALRLALHPNTPPAEAQNAMRAARNRLIRRGWKQADVEDPTGGEAPLSSLGTSVVVTISPHAPRAKTVVNKTAEELIFHISSLFDVKSYMTKKPHGSIEFTIYGRALAVETAAVEFEAAFNFIAKSAQEYNCAHDTAWKSSTTKLRNDYAFGYAVGVGKKVKTMREASNNGADDVTDTQLALYQADNMRIAAAVLSEKNVTVKTGRKRRSRQIDPSSFKDGKSKGSAHEFNADKRLKS